MYFLFRILEFASFVYPRGLDKKCVWKLEKKEGGGGGGTVLLSSHCRKAHVVALNRRTFESRERQRKRGPPFDDAIRYVGHFRRLYAPLYLTMNRTGLDEPSLPIWCCECIAWICTLLRPSWKWRDICAALDWLWWLVASFEVHVQTSSRQVTKQRQPLQELKCFVWGSSQPRSS